MEESRLTEQEPDEQLEKDYEEFLEESDPDRDFY